MVCYILRYHAEHDKPWKVWENDKIVAEFVKLDEAEEWMDWMTNIEGVPQERS